MIKLADVHFCMAIQGIHKSWSGWENLFQFKFALSDGLILLQCNNKNIFTLKV